MNRALKAAAVLLVCSIAGCGGGGGSSGGGGGGTPQAVVTRPVLQVLPATYSFGTITGSNTPAPLEVTIRNTGNAALVVDAITLASSSSAFTLNLASGTRPCGSKPTVGAGDTCTFRVEFQAPGTSGDHTAEVQITSNDAASPSFVRPITATTAAVSALTVRINQVDTSCPSNAATAYVSVTDQGGFPLRGLATTNFTLRENSTGLPLLNVAALDAVYKHLAISAALDNSGSITQQPVAYAEMKAGFASLFNAMRANDVGQLINFGTQTQVTVPFPSPSSTSNPSNKAALVNGLSVPWTGGVGTLLYDSVSRAIDDAALQLAYRRAVIVATDGIDRTEDGTRAASVSTLAQVISNARSKNVAVFAIGIGTDIDAVGLQDLAAQTGGLFYRAASSQNLAAIYAQLSSLLFQDQYVLTFNQLALGAGTVGALDLRVVSPTGIQGNGAGSIVSCQP